MIELKNIYKNYGSLEVLKNVSLKVGQGEVVVVIGPSGSGKSTLLRTINGLETVQSGEVYVDDIAVHASEANLHKARQLTGMVFQQFNLFNHKMLPWDRFMCRKNLVKKPKKLRRTYWPK